MVCQQGKHQLSIAIGKQSAEYLRQMIKQRRHRGETIDDDSWLFRGYDRRPVSKTRQEFQEWESSRGPAMAYGAVWRAVNHAADAAGVQNRKGNRPKATGE